MMRKLLPLIALLLLAATRLSAQEEVRTVGGAKYIVHTVTAGETLFALGQHYAVPLGAITAANPGSGQGLSIGQVLLIPVAAQERKELRKAPELKDGELLHTVSKKETLYGIAKRYGVAQEDIQRSNPALVRGLQPGMVLRIPVARSTAAPPAAVLPAVNDSSTAHQVMPGETVFGLAQQFGITPEQLKATNGGLPDGLRAGSYLRIPAAVAPVDTLTTVPDTALAGRVWKVALMLPFSTTPQDSASLTDAEASSVTEAAIEFNAGATLALDTLKRSGFNAEVHVFDTGDSPSSWEPLMRSDSVRGMDLYIGPFHRAAIESLGRVANNVPIVCPVPQSNKVLLGNPTVIKVVSGKPDQIQELARFIAEHHATDHVLLCLADIFGEREMQRQMRWQLRVAMQAKGASLRDSVPEVLCPRRDISKLIGLLDTGRTNVVVVPSEDVEFVTTVLSKLAPLTAKYRIVLYGMASWTDINTLDIAAMERLDTHVPASSFIDYQYPPVDAFIRRYRERYSNEPGEYAFLGYDVTLYYCSALMQFGSSFPQHFTEVSAAPLHLAFRLGKLGPENGYRNGSAVVLEYKDKGLRPAQ
jgi:LysM repeat protein